MALIAAVCSWSLVAVYLGVDPDLWGHLRFGLDAIRDGELTLVDPYSFTSDVSWINHEWLSEVFFAAAYLWGGVAGLTLLKVTIVGAVFCIMVWRLRFVPEMARSSILICAAIAISPLILTSRPQLWTVLGLTILAGTSHWTITRRAVLWPIVFAIWANLHGGWIVGLAVAAAFTVGAAIDSQDWRRAIPGFVLCAACAASTIATPYGTSLWRFMWTTVGVERQVQDWRPLWEADLTLGITWLASIGVLAICVRRVSWQWAAVLPVAMLAIGGLRVLRLAGLFGVASVLFFAPRWRATTANPRMTSGAVVLAALVGVLPSTFAFTDQSQCLPVPSDVDRVAAGALAPAAVTGRLMVPFNWGQYAIWHFGPRLKVSMDGRRETVYSQSRIDQQLLLDLGDVKIVPFIMTERPEYVWLRTRDSSFGGLLIPSAIAVASALEREGAYRRDIETDRSAILVRSDLPILRASAEMPGCFTGP